MRAERRDPPAHGSRFLAAIFDFDETIVNLEPQHTAAHDALCRAYGADYASLPESFRNGSGRRIIDDIRVMRAHFGWSASEDELFARRQEQFDAICARGELRAMDGVAESVRALQERGLRLAIASSAVRASIEKVLEQIGLRDAFPLIVDGSEVARGKPDPEIYRITAERLGVAAGACVVFEDSHVGVVAAKRAGMYCVAVRNPGAQTWQDLSAADVVVGGFGELDLTVLAPRSAPPPAG